MPIINEHVCHGLQSLQSLDQLYQVDLIKLLLHRNVPFRFSMLASVRHPEEEEEVDGEVNKRRRWFGVDIDGGGEEIDRSRSEIRRMGRTRTKLCAGETIIKL